MPQVWLCKGEIIYDEGKWVECKELECLHKIKVDHSVITTDARIRWSIYLTKTIISTYEIPRWDEWAEGWLYGERHLKSTNLINKIIDRTEEIWSYKEWNEKGIDRLRAGIIGAVIAATKWTTRAAEEMMKNNIAKADKAALKAVCCSLEVLDKETEIKWKTAEENMKTEWDLAEKKSRIGALCETALKTACEIANRIVVAETELSAIYWDHAGWAKKAQQLALLAINDEKRLAP